MEIIAWLLGVSVGFAFGFLLRDFYNIRKWEQIKKPYREISANNIWERYKRNFNHKDGEKYEVMTKEDFIKAIADKL